jgi:hypothetical protein
MSRTSRVILGLIGGAALVSFLVPYLAARWALLHLFSFGAFPALHWWPLVVVVLLALLGWLARATRSNITAQAFVVGCLAGLLIGAGVIQFLGRQAQARRTEHDRVIFSSRMPLKSLEVLDSSGHTMWRIVASDEPQVVKQLRYREVPAGFTQQVPHAGEPRFFRVDESLRMETRLLSRTETRKGKASSPDGFSVFEYVGHNQPTQSPSGPSP